MSKPWPDCLNLVKHAQLIKVGNPCLWRVNCFLGSKRLRRTDLTMTNTSNDPCVYVSQNTTRESFSKLFSNVKSNPPYPCWSDGWALVGFDILEPLSTCPSNGQFKGIISEAFAIGGIIIFYWLFHWLVCWVLRCVLAWVLALLLCLLLLQLLAWLLRWLLRWLLGWLFRCLIAWVLSGILAWVLSWSVALANYSTAYAFILHVV